MGRLKLFDVLLEQWEAADLAANDAWARLSAPRSPNSPRSNYGDDLIEAMKLQSLAIELLDALRVELRKERQQVPLI